MSICALFPADRGACGHFRVRQPGFVFAGTQMMKLHYTQQLPAMWMWGRTDIHMALTQRQIEPAQAAYWERVREKHPELRLIMDFDDLLWLPHPRSTFQITRTQIDAMDRATRAASEITVSTEPLAEQVQRRYRRPVRVLPNFIDDRHFRPVTARAPGEKLRVVWAGSNTHAPDLDQIVPAVHQTLGWIDWTFFGHVPDSLVGKVASPGHVAFDDYMPALHSIGAHVGVSPLLDNRFNQAKSNLKLLEYGALGMATIASRVTPYEGSPGALIAKPSTGAWVQALRAMNDEDTRLGVARECQAYARRFSVLSNVTTITRTFGGAPKAPVAAPAPVSALAA